MTIKIKYIIVILFVLMSSCKSNQIDKDKEKLPMIIFLNYNISKDSEGDIKVRFINKIVTEGKLKKDFSQKESFDKGDIICVQINRRFEPIQSVIIPNPFVKKVESIDDSGQLFMKLIELDSSNISVRMQLNPITKFIILEQINKPSKQLIKIRL